MLHTNKEMEGHIYDIYLIPSMFDIVTSTHKNPGYTIPMGILSGTSWQSSQTNPD